MRNLNTCVYEAEVLHRLEHVWNYLSDFPQGRTSPILALWNLRALQDESRQAGRPDLCALCELMERRIMAIQTGQCKSPEELMAQVAHMAEHVQQCACEETSEPDRPGEAQYELIREASVA